MKQVDSLIVEVTRRCNMACCHCLRGDAENASLKYDTIEALVQRLEGYSVGTVTFGGGEPSLAIKECEWLIDAFSSHGIDVQRWYLVTNAKRVTDEFLELLGKMYDHSSMEDMWGIDISRDQHHERLDWENVERIQQHTGMFSSQWDHAQRERAHLKEERVPESRIIGMGRGINVGAAPVRVWPYGFIEENDGEDVCIETDFHVNVDGEVYSHCDLSYSFQREHPEFRIGDVNNPGFDFHEAALEWNERFPEVFCVNEFGILSNKYI